MQRNTARDTRNTDPVAKGSRDCAVAEVCLQRAAFPQNTSANSSSTHTHTHGKRLHGRRGRSSKTWWPPGSSLTGAASLSLSLNSTVPGRGVWFVQSYDSSSDRCALSQSTAARNRTMKPVWLSRCIVIGLLSRCSSMFPVHVVLKYSTVTDARLMNGLSAG